MLLKRLRIIAYIFLVAAIFVCIWQRDNIAVLIYAATMDRDDLAQSNVKTETELKESLNTKGLTLPAISQDDVNSIIQSGVTAREAAEELLRKQAGTAADINADIDNETEAAVEPIEVTDSGKGSENVKSNSSVKPSDTPTEAVNKETDNKANTDEAKERLNYELNLRITELYILETSYSSQIDTIINDAKQEYLALKKEDQTKTNRYKIILRKIDVITDLETECDGKVKTLVSEIKSLLTEAGMDTGLGDDIMNYYANRKKEQKALYLKDM